MIIMASDHRGYLLKEELKAFFNQENIITIDVGTYSKEPVDYPDFAKLGMAKLLENKNNVGIFICGSGIGMSIAANRNPNVRAALCLNTTMASLARKDNDANVLCLGGNFISRRKAISIVKVFLTTPFEGGRHSRRLKKISSGEFETKPIKVEKVSTQSAAEKDANLTSKVKSSSAKKTSQKEQKSNQTKSSKKSKKSAENGFEKNK